MYNTIPHITSWKSFGTTFRISNVSKLWNKNFLSNLFLTHARRRLITLWKVVLYYLWFSRGDTGQTSVPCDTGMSTGRVLACRGVWLCVYHSVVSVTCIISKSLWWNYRFWHLALVVYFLRKVGALSRVSDLKALVF